MYSFIKQMGDFCFTPQFLIPKDSKYTSKIRGFKFILFSIFILLFFSTLINFIYDRALVYSSNYLLKYSGNFTLETSSIYFGIGLIYFNYKEYYY